MKYMLVLVFLFCNVAHASTQQVEKLDNDIHQLGGCSAALVVKETARAIGYEHYNLIALSGALLVALAANKYADGSPNFEDKRNTMFGATACIGLTFAF